MYILERIEENFAVIYDKNGNKTDVEVSAINGTIKDGVVLKKTDNGWFVDEAETEKRRVLLSKRLNNLFKK